MATSINNRKRSRSENEYDFVIQSKQFVSEQTINENNQSKMKEIHDKTIRLLFQNANPKSAGKTNNNNVIDTEIEVIREEQPGKTGHVFGDNICLRGDGKVNYIDANSKFAQENVSRRCRFCAKPSSIQATDCVNCNLEICEFCGISCLQCNAPLCLSCVQLFGCHDNSVDMNACCERCKTIYNFQ